MEDVTLVIQGRLLEDTYKFYCLYYPNTKKVFSTWKNNEEENKWRTPPDVHGPNDIFLRSEMPNNIGKHERNLQLQVVSTLAGLEMVETKYSIKLRGDEWYSNLYSVQQIMKKDNQKIYTIPVFFRKWNVFPFHPSDHLMASSTENLKTMFGRCLISILTNKDLMPKEEYYKQQNLLTNFQNMPPECVLAKSYMDCKLKKDTYEKEDFKNLFDIIPIDNLKYYKVSVNSLNRCWYSNFDPHDDGTLGSIASIDEL